MFEEAIAKVRELPEDDQDEAAAMLLSVASKKADLVQLDDETRAAIGEGGSDVLHGVAQFGPEQAEEVDHAALAGGRVEQAAESEGGADQFPAC